MSNDDSARAQAQAQVTSVVEMVAALECDYDRLAELREMHDAGNYEGNWAESDEAAELSDLESAAGDCTDEDDARQRIMEDALSVEVRTGWHNPGESAGPEEFRIVLCTGGPHVELRGDLNGGEPERVTVHYADWGTSGEFFPTDDERRALLTYCRQFYFGE